MSGTKTKLVEKKSKTNPKNWFMEFLSYIIESMSLYVASV